MPDDFNYQSDMDMRDGSKEKVVIEQEGKKKTVCEHIQQNLLLLLTLLAICLGFGIGFAIRVANPSADALMWLGFPGEIYLRLLKLMIIPLIVSNVIAGTAKLDPKANGKISLVSLGFITVTNAIGAFMGVVLAILLKPGLASQVTSSFVKYEADDTLLQTQDIFADLIRNIFPDNVVGCAVYQVRTFYPPAGQPDAVLNETESNATDVVIRSRTLVKDSGTNILGLIFCCLIFGIATGLAGEKGKPFLNFFDSAAEIVLIIMRWFLWYTPIGILSLIAASVAGIDDIVGTFRQLGMFVLTVAIGIAIHQIILIPTVHLIVWRKNPLILYLAMLRAWFIMFASTSTAVAMPEMFRACDEYNIDKRVSRFVIPFSVTLNADGSAVFIAVSTIFIGQMIGYPLNAATFITIGVLTTVSAMAIPSVPSASIVAIVILMTSLGMPTTAISLLFAVEWILDRLRTTSNGVSHVFGTAFTYKLCLKELQRLDKGRVDDGKSSLMMEITVL